MTRWRRVLGAALGNGLTFAVAAGVVTSAAGTAALVFGNATVRDVLETVGRVSVVSGLLGVLFSGLLITAVRRRQLGSLPLMRFIGLGAGAGLLYFAFLLANAYRSWTVSLALWNAALLVGIGAGAAGGIVLIARRGQPRLHDESTHEPARPHQGVRVLEGGAEASNAPTRAGFKGSESLSARDVQGL
jgi:ABC-type transport system involved in multi-copper enzyme maturation permease subunit